MHCHLRNIIVLTHCNEKENNMDKKPKCKLIGEDGNIFNLVGIAARTLRQNGMEEQAKELCERLKEQPDYDHALMLIANYVDIV